VCEISDGIAVLTLNRPEKLNAINYAMIATLDALETDRRVGAVIVTGAGERAFSAGGDITEFSESVRRGPAAAVRDFVRRGQGMTARMEAFPKPIIAAVCRGLNMTIGEGLQVESEQFARVVPTSDIREGLDAWIERRQPAFAGE
jgi:enoyl-CoA hydratase/carnithine racemase